MAQTRLAVLFILSTVLSVTAWSAGTHDDDVLDEAKTRAATNDAAPHPEHDTDDHGTREAGADMAHGNVERHGAAEGDEHGHGDEHAHGDEHGEEGRVELTDDAQAAAGIQIQQVSPQAVSATITAPGEVRFNAYRTSKVTPRLAAQIVERFAKLGDRVSAGQRLASLSSVEMAEAQGAMFIAAREWARVQRLGEQTVSEKRYSEAKIAYQQARAKLLSYGLPEAQLKALLQRDDSTLATGTFDVLAPRAGTVTNDDFIEGEFVEPGRVLFEITDESQLWIESRVAPAEAAMITIGADAAVVTEEGARWAGKVVQVHRQVDEDTRTVGVRIALDNADGRLRPGLFVQTQLTGADTIQAFVLPQQAVVRTPDGDWGVYRETAPGQFELVEVKFAREIDGKVIVSGLEPGSRVVTQGAFFIQSEQAKSGFDPHNH